MKTSVNIPVRVTSSALVHGGMNQSGYPCMELRDFTDLAQFCLKEKMSPSLERTGIEISSFTVQCDENHPGLPNLMNRLEALGWRPVPRLLTVNTPECGYFPLRIVLSFDKKEMDSASHMHMYNWGSINAFLSPKWDEKYEFCGYSTKSMSGYWAHDFLEVQGLRGFAVSEVGRKVLEAGGLRGLIFHEAEWDIPKKMKRPFFIVDCERKMPPCLLPVVNEKSLDQTGWYLDGPYDPPILQFNNSQVGDVIDVDAAWTLESLRPNPKLAMNSSPSNHSLIISARFRKILQAAKVKHQAFPVMWVDGSRAIDHIPPFIKHSSMQDWMESIV